MHRRHGRAPNIAKHAGVLFGTISALLAGCNDQAARETGATSAAATTSATAGEVTSAGTTASGAAASATPSSSPAASASAAASAGASASAASSSSASASANSSASAVASVKPPTPRPPRPPPPPLPKKPTWIEGRPFLVHGQARLAGVGTRGGWAHSLGETEIVTTPAERALLIEHYTQWALAEHASVASFARFTLQLMALGAPSDLVDRAIAAQADEVRHARFGFGLVAMLSGEPAAPEQLCIDDALAVVTLHETLRLTVREGMIGETLAALEAHIATDAEMMPFLSEGLATLAEEESRHAELAYAFAAWALQQDPQLASVVLEEVERWQPPSLPARPGLARWGILDAPTRSDIQRRGFETLVRPLVAQLVSGCTADDPHDVRMPSSVA